MTDETTADKSLGQHWLTDSVSLDAICDSADLEPGGTVLEIGPGQGSLTSVLLARGVQVIGVELDERLAAELRQKFTNLPFTLNMLSILDFDLSSLPVDYKIVANIPYYLTAHLLRMLSETPHKPQLAVLLVQKEVAERVAAQPGTMSTISVAIQLEYQVSLGQLVPARLFTPPPKVNSQVLIMKQRTEPLFADINKKAFLRLVKAGFANRRKTLLNSLSAGLRLSKPEVNQLLEQANILPSVRAQELSLNDWHRLYLVESRKRYTKMRLGGHKLGS